jgi:hypothetical protein
MAKQGLECVLRRIYTYIRFHVFMEVNMKNAVFWDVAPCRSCVNRHFGGTYRFRLQGRKIRERGTSVSRWLQTAATCSRWFLATSQKTAFFIYVYVFKCVPVILLAIFYPPPTFMFIYFGSKMHCLTYYRAPCCLCCC